MNFRFDRYMQNLDISDNVIESLDKTSLRDLGVISLVKLNASRNYISDIDERAFLGQRKLQTVDLSSNSLVIIEPKTFMRNPSLEILSLSSNQDLRLPEEGPFLASRYLRVLKLSDCNLDHLSPEAFQELPNLQELYISHNQIETLNSLQGVGRLRLLDISHNYLTELQSEFFTALPELIRLNLSYNSFSILDTTVMPQLSKVSSSIDLYGNPWVCDCLMFNTIYSWCRDNSVYLDLVCSSPPKFKDTSWTIYDKFDCFDGDYIADISEEVEGIVNNNEKFLPNRNYEEYAYNENFEKNENSLPTGFQEKDTTLNYKNDDVSFAVVAEVPSEYLVLFLWFFFKFLIFS